MVAKGVANGAAKGVAKEVAKWWRKRWREGVVAICARSVCGGPYSIRNVRIYSMWANAWLK